MPKCNFMQTKDIGEQFIQYLRDTGREGVNDWMTLKAVYNEEFRYRDNIRRPNFSCVLYVLSKSHSAVRRGDFVQFGEVKKKIKLTDQYWKPRHNAAAGAGDQFTQDQRKFTGPPPPLSHVKNRSDFVSRKYGIKIVSKYDVSDDKIRFNITPNQSETFTIEVKNYGTYEVVLKKCSQKTRYQFTFVLHESPSAVKLPPGSTHEIQVTCQVPDYGCFPITLTFHFTCEQTGELFFISRFVSAAANTKLAEQLGPTAPYRHYQAKLQGPKYTTIRDGFPPENTLQFELERKPLKQYKYPADLKDLIPYLTDGHVSNGDTGAKAAQLQSTLQAPLQFENYSKKLCLLLHLEEIQMEVDIHRYDMYNVSMSVDKHNKKLLVLKVPGVAENRPSVLKGDHLFVTLAEEHRNYSAIQYKGYVHGVEMDQVKLGFSEKLQNKFVNNMKFDVMFTFSRLSLRLQHQAAILAKERQLSHLLFPSFCQENPLQTNQRLRLYNSKLEKNKEQNHAVHQVVAGVSRPAPYLIFGPPGTGKTITMVEAIKQVLRCNEGTHVLACAPSNSTSDLLCKLLMEHVEKRSIYRMNASSREYYTIPEDIKPICNWDKTNNCPEFPSKQKLQSYRVIITTLVTAGRLVSADFPRGHFSHVFIDESGFAMETETLIAISGILDMMDPKTNVNGGQLVLAGDPEQLGPTLRSPLAIKHGLGFSLLERLMRTNPLYQKENGKYNSKFVTKLLRNYRSHPAILKFPNDKFYDGELQEHAEPSIAYSYCNWEELVKQGFPIIFHGVCGEDQREERSPSFFNTAEVAVLISYLKKLLENQGKKGMSRITPKEIGIISPYRKQVEKIRQAINIELKSLVNIKDLKVGSVEDFQGQERRVVLVSTVRSSSNYFAMDEEFNLGFLNNPKRLNVAITRAKALLIVIGNPVTLSKDQHWSEFIEYCKENKACRGYQYEKDDNAVPITELQLLSLDDQPPVNGLRESYLQQQVEPEWRSEH